MLGKNQAALVDGTTTKILQLGELDEKTRSALGIKSDQEGILVRKFGITESTKEDQDTGEVVSIISTEAVDREGDIILASGWRLSNYRKTPTVLFGHNYWELPIGKGRVRIDRENKTLIAATKYLDHEFAQDVRNADIAKVLGSSVGFIPIDYEPRTADDNDDSKGTSTGGRLGTRFKRQELLEYSKVPIPANPECVTLGLKALGGDQDALEELRKAVRDLAANRKTFLLRHTQQRNIDDPAPTDPPPAVKAEVTIDAPEGIQAILEEIREGISDLGAEIEEIRICASRAPGPGGRPPIIGPTNHPYNRETLEPGSAGASRQQVDLRRALERNRQVALRLKKTRGGEKA